MDLHRDAVLADSDTRTADSLPPLLSVASLILVGVAPVHHVLEPGRASAFVAAVCGGLAVVFAAARVSLRSRRVRAFVERHPHDVMLAACLLATVAAGSELVAFARPVSAGGLVVFLLGAGVLTARRRDARVVGAVVLAQWFAVATWQGFSGAWVPLSVLVVCAAVLAHVLEAIRRRATDHLARAEVMILEAAVTDDLTGLRNRRGLLAAGQQALSSQPAEPLTVVYVDLDGLKRTNDELGHAAGDRLLRTAATALSRTARQDDVVARLGGDEFAVLLPGAGTTAAQAARQRFERALGAAGVPASVGVATSTGSQHADSALQTLLDEADAAMYAVKQQHRVAPAVAIAADRELPEPDRDDVVRGAQSVARDRVLASPGVGTTAVLDLVDLAKATSGLHVALVPVHLLLLPTVPGWTMAVASMAVAVLSAALLLPFLRFRVSRHAEALICAVMVVLCVETVGYSALAPERWASLATVLALISAGGTLAGSRRVAAVCGVTLLAWFAVELERGLDVETPSYVIPVVSGAGLSALLHVVHHRTLTRLAATEERVRAIAMTDELTGLPNRRAFLAAGRPLVELSLRRGEHVSVLFLDLDGLKQVNDQEGHAAGDRLLTTAARVLRQSLAPQDLLARLAGDEFSILVHGCSPDDVPARVAWLEASLGREGVAASIGAAHLACDARSLDGLVDRADEAMLLVKQDRRRAARAQPAGSDRLMAGSAGEPT